MANQNTGGGGTGTNPNPTPPTYTQTQKDCATKTGFNLADLDPNAVTATQGAFRAEYDACMTPPEPNKTIFQMPIFWIVVAGLILLAVIGSKNAPTA